MIQFKTSHINDLSRIEYFLADKTGTVTDNTVSISACYALNMIHYRENIERNHTNQIETTQRNDLSGQNKPEMVWSGDDSEFIQSLNGFDYLMQSCQRPSDDLKLLIYNMAICNSVIPQDTVDDSPYNIDLLQVHFAKQLGYKLVLRDKSRIEIRKPEGLLYFTVQSNTTCSDYKECRRCIVTKDEKIYYFVKTESKKILQSLAFEYSQIQIADIVKSFKDQGMRVIIFLHKAIDKKQLEEFQKIEEQSLLLGINMDQKIERAYKQFENEMRLGGIIGIVDNIPQENKEAIKKIAEAGIKIWLISGDSEQSTLVTAQNLELIGPDLEIESFKQYESPHVLIKMLKRAINQRIFHEEVDQTTYKEQNNSVQLSGLVKQTGQFLIESILQRRRVRRNTVTYVQSHKSTNSAIHHVISLHPLYKSATKHDKDVLEARKAYSPTLIQYGVIIDGISLETALKSKSATKLLLCLLFCAESVCFSGLLPHHKGKIAHLIKNAYKFKPVIMGVGNELADVPFLKECDISIGMYKDSRAANYCDITIESLQCIPGLLLTYGHTLQRNIAKVVVICIYKQILLSTAYFIYIFYSDYSGIEILQGFLEFSFDFIITLIPICAIGVLDRNISNRQMERYPFIYGVGIKEKYLNNRLIIQNIIYGFVHAVIVIMCILYQLTAICNTKGFTESILLIKVTLYVTVVLTTIYLTLLQNITLNKLLIISYFLAILATIGVLNLLSFVPITDKSSLGIFQIYLTSPLAITNSLLIPLICILIVLAHKFYQKLFMPSELDIIQSEKPMKDSFSFKGQRMTEYQMSLLKVIDGKYFYAWEQEQESFKMYKKTLLFNNFVLESEYQTFNMQNNLNRNRLFFIIIALAELILTLVLYYEVQENEGLLMNRSIACFVFLVIGMLAFTRVYKKFSNIIVTCLILAYCIQFFVDGRFLDNSSIPAAILNIQIIFGFLYMNFVHIIIITSINILLIIIDVLIQITFDQYSIMLSSIFISETVILCLAISITYGIANYAWHTKLRNDYLLLKQVNEEFSRSQTILSYLLPPFVKDRVKEGARYIAEDQGYVTVLFCDICDFDKFLIDYEPSEITSFLDMLFKKFDILCDKNGVTKIETVGKTYMAAAGLKDSEMDMDPEITKLSHARRAIELGISMLNTVSGIRLKSGDNLKVKIGINSGPVIAGVVGFHKPQFSLVGDTVNTASRMCSTIKKYNRIQISSSTYELVQRSKGLVFKPNTIEAKGKGMMETFFVKENFTLMSYWKKTVTSYYQSSDTNHLQSDFIASRQRTAQGFTSILTLNESQRSSLFQRVNTEILEVGNLLFFTCKSTTKQKEFHRNYLEENYQIMRAILYLNFITCSLMLISELLGYINDDKYSSIISIILRASYILLAIPINLVFPKYYQRFTFHGLLISHLVLGGLIPQFRIIDAEMLPYMLNGVETLYYIVMIVQAIGTAFRNKFWPTVILLFTVILTTSTANYTKVEKIQLYYMLGLYIISIIQSRSKETIIKQNANLSRAAQLEAEQTNALLKQMVPAHIFTALQEGKSITDRHFDVTILYADIVGFTQWSSNKTPEQVVTMLSNLFTEFDKMCLMFQVYKVHTIGDCYVVLALKENNLIDSCMNVVNFAIEMLEVIDKINFEYGINLNMRIGIHIGDIIGGIIGTQIVRYDIYGLDSSIANKMESEGASGRINVSEKVKDLIEDQRPKEFDFEFNKEVVSQSLGIKIGSYFLNNNLQQKIQK